MSSSKESFKTPRYRVPNEQNQMSAQGAGAFGSAGSAKGDRKYRGGKFAASAAASSTPTAGPSRIPLTTAARRRVARLGVTPRLDGVENIDGMMYVWNYSQALYYMKDLNSKGHIFKTEERDVRFEGGVYVFDGTWDFLMQKPAGRDMQVKVLFNKVGPRWLNFEFVVELSITHGKKLYNMGSRLSGKEIRTQICTLDQFAMLGLAGDRRTFCMEWKVKDALMQLMAASANTVSPDLSITFLITARSYPSSAGI